MAKTRQSNIELCRIIAILAVMLIHTTFQSLGFNVSFGVLLLAGFSIIGVNVFVMLTGFFTATPKKTSLFNLAFICFFWMVVKVLCRFVCNEPITYKLFFFVTTSNWFLPSYIGLLFFAPILNFFCNMVNKKTLRGVVTAMLIIEIWFDWLPPHPSISLGTNGGHSVLSFLILYLLARAIRLYGLPTWFKRLSTLIYLLCSLLLAFLGLFLLWHGNEDMVGWLFYDNNPIVILSSVAFLSMFEKMKLKPSKFINHVAKSTLAVLLGHSAIFFAYTKQFKYLYDHFSNMHVVLFWALSIIIVFCSIILIDQIRIWLYQPIEKKMMAKINNNNIFELPTH